MHIFMKGKLPWRKGCIFDANPTIPHPTKDWKLYYFQGLSSLTNIRSSQCTTVVSKKSGKCNPQITVHQQKESKLPRSDMASQTCIYCNQL